ncbi:uncharacterized protein LOC124361755 [Homalodisca vitripennis]|uniref:uncharacterized protein LOC124361755 n=1 Tax=Homalodisca vitripennis TaxID=197043 RepID=UPI001EEB372F|nr:uncharacterized protein LOC124361755 [Homalodisca vitripennis]
MAPSRVSRSEIQKLRTKQTSFQLEFPELFKSDSSIYPSYSRLRIPYRVICRMRKDAYATVQARRMQAEIDELALRHNRAWDGVRIDRIFSWGFRPGGLPAVPKVPDPLTSKERQRLYRILYS